MNITENISTPVKGSVDTESIGDIAVQTFKEQNKKEPLTDYDKWLQSLPELAKDQSTVSVTPSPKEGMRGFFDKAAGVFKSEQPIIGEGGAAATKVMRTPDGKVVRVPVTMSQMDPLKVGLGSLGAAGVAYGLGAFDPVPPKDPKYPGYNKFYAQDPSQFMPYDDPNIDPIDYSQYPEKPYSGIKTGGIIGLQDGGPASYKNILQTEYGYERDYLDNLEMNEGPGAVKELYDSLQGKKSGGIMKLMSGGQTLSPQELFNKVMMEGYRPTPEEQQLINQYLQSQSGQKKGGIMKLVRGGKADNEPVKSLAEMTDEELEEYPRQRMQPQPQQPRMPGREQPQAPGRKMSPDDLRKKLQESLQFMTAKSGSLVDKLPHKTKKNENNPSNYKRTSGKLVVDAEGKGNEERDTMLAQLADGEFVTKSKAVRGAGIALGANPKNKKQQRDLGARFFYKQMAEFDKLAKRMAS